MFEPNNILANVEDNNRSYKVYPNPVNENRKITLLNESSLEITGVRIIDLKGNIVFESNSFDGKEKFTLLLTKLHKGIYVIYLSFADGTTRSTKIILN